MEVGLAVGRGCRWWASWPHLRMGWGVRSVVELAREKGHRLMGWWGLIGREAGCGKGKWAVSWLDLPLIGVSRPI